MVPEYHIEENDQQTSVAEEDGQKDAEEEQMIITTGPVLVTPGVKDLP